MAVALGKGVRKLTRMKIRAISLVGKALLEEDVFERVCREAQGNFSFYLSRAWQVKWTHLYRVFCLVDLSSTAVRPFFISSAKKGKAVLQVRWHEFVCQVLGSQEVSEIVKDMSSQDKNVVSCFLESVFIAGFKFVRERQEDSSGRINVTTGRMNIVQDNVSMLKLGSASVEPKKMFMEDFPATL